VARLDEYYRDPHPPPVQGLLPVAYAVVRDRSDGRVLLVRRADDGNWELPGGRVDVGESAAAAAVREVAEEAGIAVELTGLVGVFSDPSHIVVYVQEGARQQLAVCFHAVPRQRDDTTARPDHDETIAATWFDPADTAALAMHPAVRERLTHALDHPGRPHFD
jgi:8-oxo-dGTP pyrophosphatase MutT (NUDIX family)